MTMQAEQVRIGGRMLYGEGAHATSYKFACDESGLVIVFADIIGWSLPRLR